jgi:FeS assembly SUF system protein
MSAPPTRQAVIDAVKTVFDPEIPVNIWELGLVYEINIADNGAVHIVMTLTSPSCPVAEEVPIDVDKAVRAVPGVGEVDIELVWDPPWDPDMMSESAQLELGML